MGLTRGLTDISSVRRGTTELSAIRRGQDLIWPPAGGIIQTNLTLWLDASNTSSYPGSGTTWTDISSTGGTYTLTNGAAYSSDAGGCITTDGNNQFVSGTNAGGNFDVTDSYTWHMWMYRTGDAVRTEEIWMHTYNGNSPYGGFQMRMFRGTYIPRNVFQNASAQAQEVFANTAISLATWQHLTFVCDYSASTYYWYINGVAAGSAAATRYVAPSTLNLRIGGVGSGYAWNGKFGEVEAYNVALTQTQIQYNFDQTKTRYGY
jgi:hypothetical protein